MSIVVEIKCAHCDAFKLVRCKSHAVAGAIQAELLKFACPRCRKNNPEHVDVLSELVKVDNELARKGS